MPTNLSTGEEKSPLTPLQGKLSSLDEVGELFSLSSLIARILA